MDDPMIRRREMTDSVARKARWTAALARFGDQHGRQPTRQEAAQIRAAAMTTHPKQEAA